MFCVANIIFDKVSAEAPGPSTGDRFWKPSGALVSRARAGEAGTRRRDAAKGLSWRSYTKRFGKPGNLV